MLTIRDIVDIQGWFLHFCPRALQIGSLHVYNFIMSKILITSLRLLLLPCYSLHWTKHTIAQILILSFRRHLKATWSWSQRVGSKLTLAFRARQKDCQDQLTCCKEMKARCRYEGNLLKPSHLDSPSLCEYTEGLW